MLVTHLDHLNLSVRDLRESLDFYARVFGFERVESGVKDGVPWAIVRSGEALLCLYQHPDRELLDQDGLEQRGVHGLNHIGLRVRDRAAWEATVEREGLTVRYGGVVHWPRSQSWYVLDPTGYEIEVALWQDGRPDFSGEPMAADARPWSAG